MIAVDKLHVNIQNEPHCPLDSDLSGQWIVLSALWTACQGLSLENCIMSLASYYLLDQDQVDHKACPVGPQSHSLQPSQPKTDDTLQCG